MIRVNSNRSSERFLFGFKISAKIKAWRLRRQGFETIIQHEYVKANGEMLTVLHKGIHWHTLAPFWAGWPDLKIAWVVYAKLGDGN